MAPGDVYIAYFLQEEQEYADRRPCLILAVEKDKVLAAKITTTPIRGYLGIHISAGESDVKEGFIMRESYVNLSRIQWVANIDLIKKIATVKDEILEEVRKRISEIS